MAHPLMSHKRAQALSISLFLVGLAILSFTNLWWPGIMLVVGIPLALRQFLLGKRYDTVISLFIFIGVFVTVQLNFSWEYILPIIFICGAIYIFFRDFVESEVIPEAEKEEDVNEEIEEEEMKR